MSTFASQWKFYQTHYGHCLIMMLMSNYISFDQKSPGRKRSIRILDSGKSNEARSAVHTGPCATAAFHYP